MKRKLLRLVQTVCFLAVLFITYSFVAQTLKLKHHDGIRPMENYYALPEDTVDVLFLGSSHAGMNIDPGALWDEKGIASYICWGSVQPMWSTYYYLQECLKTQRPRLVVMDTYVATMDMEYSDYEAMVKSLLGMRLSREKLEAIAVAAPPQYRADVLLGFPTYHYRYSDLTSADFEYYFWQKDSSLPRLISSDDVHPFEIMDTQSVTGSDPLHEKEREYLLKIIECCRERELPLLLIAAPYEIPEREQRRLNAVGEIARENGLVFLNFNESYREVGIDPQRDYVDPGHLNNAGIAKYSGYLAEYLDAHYDLPDRREDPGHIWNREEVYEEAPTVYALEEPFHGGGVRYVNTRVALYRKPYLNYTVLARLNTTCDSGDMVYLACFAEEEDNYRGLLVRKEADGAIHIVLTPMYGMVLEEFGELLDLAIVKDGLNYRIYADGQLVNEITTDEFDPYDGPLLIGCEFDANGNPMRYSKVSVHDLQVYDSALDDADVREWQPRNLPQGQAAQTGGDGV